MCFNTDDKHCTKMFGSKAWLTLKSIQLCVFSKEGRAISFYILSI